MARKRSRDPERLQDLIAAGNIGLLTAVDKYDLTRRPAPRFLTYAGGWIQKEISDEDYATTMATLEKMALNLGWSEDDDFGPRGRGFGPGFGRGPKRGFGRGFGPGFGHGHGHHDHPHHRPENAQDSSPAAEPEA